MKKKLEIILYETTTEEALLTLDELCRFASLNEELVNAFFLSGLIDPLEEEPELRFDPNVIARIRKIERLRHDLGVNLAGIGVILDLLDKITELENEVDFYRRKSFKL